jgi:predicted small integral membrane protein
MDSLILGQIHKHYGTLLILLVLVALHLAFFSEPKVKLQRIVAVLVDINLVVGIWAFFTTVRPISYFHPIFVLGAVGLLHASAKSDQRKKVIICFSAALGCLVLAWMVNASWGPEWFKTHAVFLPSVTKS